jgi:hypothetical protein
MRGEKHTIQRDGVVELTVANVQVLLEAHDTRVSDVATILGISG